MRLGAGLTASTSGHALTSMTPSPPVEATDWPDMVRFMLDDKGIPGELERPNYCSSPDRT